MPRPLRQGDWIETFTGRRFWPLDPQVSDVVIEDIAHALSMLCRYNGHCRCFYSVAEHSVHVAAYMAKTPIGQYDRDLQLAALLHDAAEAYLADVPSPIKPFLTNYYEAEARVEKVIAVAFGLDMAEASPFIKRIDTRIRVDESKALMPRASDWSDTLGRPLGITILGWSPAEAEARFLEAFYKCSKPVEVQDEPS